MKTGELNDTARALVAPAKGILAADESTNTIKRRFDSINVESTEQSRRDYREMLFRTPGANEFISGVILYDETLRQRGADGTPIVSILQDQGIIPGIKVDKSTHHLPNTDGEVITEGLDGLRDRLAEYHAIGARFAKWRAVINIGQGNIGENIPSQYCIDANAHALARYAALSQEAGLVPIVEPEAVMDGEHTIERCHEVTLNALHSTYDELARQRVDLRGTLLKANMVVSGKDASDRADANEVAERTLDALLREVPAAVPGIVFLSGGQTDDEATENLQAINVAAENMSTPWELSFSYGRALQSAPLKTWGGDAANTEAAQQEYYRRAMLNSAARQGKYTPGTGV